jgi:ribose-phosphate pyrophosphokinase
MSSFVVTGNFSDSPVALDVGQYIEIPFDISDMVSLKTFANSEFCPRFIPEGGEDHVMGQGLKGRTVIICSSSHSLLSRNDLAMRNLILARAAKDNHAQRVILVEDDLFYSAQDRGPSRGNAQERSDVDLAKFDGQPFTARLYAELLKAAGVDTVMTVHIHSHRVQELFKEVFGGDFHDLIPAEVYAHYICNSDFVDVGANGSNLVLCAPDKGAAPFVDMVSRDLGLPDCRTLIVDKVRSGEREVSMKVSRQSGCTIEDLAGRDVIILDDMVRTGTTIVECANLLRTGKPRRVCFCVTHFHPSEEARENLSSRLIDEILTTSTIPSILNRDCQGRLRRKLAVLKIGRWVSRRILQLLGADDERPGGDLYSVDMSSKNPRWSGAGAA